jgi:hypothetical protein
VINYIKDRGKFPSYSEALHLFDMANQLKYEHSPKIRKNVNKEQLEKQENNNKAMNEKLQTINK